MKHLLLLSLFFLKINQAYSNEFKINVEESETKEQIAKSLNINAQQIAIYPMAIQYVKSKSSSDYGINVKGKVFITWAARDIISSDEQFNYTRDNISFQNDSSVAGTNEGEIIGTLKIGYQITNNFQIDGSFERKNSSMNLTALNDSLPIGSIIGFDPLSIENEFTTIKIGLTTNFNLIQAKSWRMDLLVGANAGAIGLQSSYGTQSDLYDGAIGYTYGAESGVRVLHNSGFNFQVGVGANNKTIAPKTYYDGSESSIDGTETYVYIGVGYAFGGKKKK